MKWKSPFLVKPGEKIRLESIDASEHAGVKHKDDADELLRKYRDRLERMQELLYASQNRALLIVLQGMDTAGKDGTIRTIFTGVNPQGCQVASFKVPTPLEARHDFLWRCHAQVPALGDIGIFNRSHYEQVLSPRVHGHLSRKEARANLDEINGWEAMLTDSGVQIIKFFLHISHKEQTERLQARIDDPSKHWKLSASDFAERRFWSEYMEAYEDILERSSTKAAPWFVIPSNRKWYRSVAVARVIDEALAAMDLKYPQATIDPSAIDLHGKAGKAEDAATREVPPTKGEHSKEEPQPISGKV